MTANNHPTLGLATSDEVKEAIQTDDKYCIGALLMLYSFQTPDEQKVNSTAHDNGAGFNSTDAYVMSDISKWYLNKGYLTDKQVAFARTKILKYHTQLVGLEVELIPNKQKPKLKTTDKISEPVLTTTLEKNKLLIKFQFPKGDQRFYDMVAKVKTLSGRRFDIKQKFWTAPIGDENVTRLAEWGFRFDKALQAWNEQQVIGEIDTALTIPGLQLEPYPFQREGVAFIESRNGNALIGDEMGLGKTMQALCYLQLHPELRPAIIIPPASLKLNWAREVNMWMSTKKKTKLLNGMAPKLPKKPDKPNHKDSKKQAKAMKKYKTAIKIYKTAMEVYDAEMVPWMQYQDGELYPLADIYILNYDIVGSWNDALLGLDPKCIILDECQMIKNAGNKKKPVIRTVETMRLAKEIPNVIGLSGTPIDNRPAEFYNILSLCRPSLFPKRWDFLKEFCDPVHNGFGWSFNGATNVAKLHTMVKTVMIRRKKADVLKQLPAKVRSVIPLEIDNWNEYNKVEARTIQELQELTKRNPDKDAMKAAAMVIYEKLKQAALKGKLKAAIQWIEDYIDGNGKLVVFCWHKEALAMLEKHFGNIAISTARASTASKRQAAVDRFQNDPEIRLFLGQVKRDGVGHTLTAASSTATLELGWNPSWHDQAEDRVHRIGQEADSVNAYYLLAAGTVEEPIAELIDAKRKVISQVLDGKEVESAEILMDLLNITLQKRKEAA